MEEIAAREYRVWCASGDPVGCASVYHRRAWWTVELDPFYFAERTKPKGFRSKEAAYTYAKEHAEKYLEQVVEAERLIHEQDGCCVPTEDDLNNWRECHHMQVVEEDRTLKPGEY